MEKKVILISENDLKENSNIEWNNDNKSLSFSILDVQNLYLKPILGEKLYSEVVSAVYLSATDISYVMENRIADLLGQIKSYLIHAVIVDYLFVNNYKSTNKGVLKMHDSSAQDINSQELEYAKNYYEGKMTAYKNSLINYLKNNELASIKSDKDITTDVIGWYLPGLN